MTTFTFKFDYNNKQTQPFTCLEDEKIEGPFGKFASSENKSIEDFAFYYKTFLIKDFDKSLNKTIFSNSGKKEIMILAILLKLDKSKEENAKEKKETIPEEKKVEKKEEPKEEKKEEKEEEPKKEVLENYFDVICPECKTSAIIDIDNDKRGYDLKILNCENFHNLRKLNYDIYEQFNIFDTKDDSFEHLEELLKSYSDLLKCGQCGNNRLYMTPPEDKLSFCFACGINICPECMNTHEPSHKDKIFPLEDKNYYCIKHAKKFISYCIDCNCNICEDCKSSHPDNEHETYDFDKIKPSQDDVKEFSKKVEEHKKQLKNFISSTKEFFNKMITTAEAYINSYILIESTLIKRFKEDKKMNFQLIRNLSNEKIFDNVLFNDLENPPRIGKDPYYDPNNPFEKIKFLNSLYSKINEIKKKEDKKAPPANTKNKIVIKYEIKNLNENNKKVRILDEIFVKNNKDRLSVSIDGKQFAEGLKAYYNIPKDPKDTQKDTKVLTVTLTEKEKAVVDMSYMLNNCKYVKSVDFKDWDTRNVISMEAMFQLTPLEKIPKEFSKFVTPKLKNIRALFCKCVNIKEIPELKSIFNKTDKTDNSNKIANISMLFNGCKNLSNVDGKEWHGKNIEDMSYAFNRCKNLKTIDLGNIKIDNVKDMCGLFNGCESLTKIPSVITSSKTPNVEDISIMFQGCSNLESIDVSNFTTPKVKDMNGIFSGCKKLKKKVNMKYWSTDNVKEMIGMFNNCENLPEVTLPAKMNLGNVQNASGMFYGCEKLKTLGGDDYLKFTNKNVKVENIFDKCQNYGKRQKVLSSLIPKDENKII